MKTIEAKNEEARSLVEMSIESPSMVRDLMYAVEGGHDWEFYEVDSAATDDMTAFFTRNFGHVFRVDIPHLDKTDGRLHRIYMSNE